jgi:flagellar hook assembly protein FlgD
VFSPPGTLSGLDSVVESGRPTFYLSLCGDVSIVVDSRTIGNPFTPGQTLVPASGTSLVPGTRVEVSLLPAIRAKLASKQIRGTVTIYDAVGNLVVEKSDLTADVTNANAKLYFIWDGKTKKSSMASAGSYLARIVIEDLENGRKQSIRQNIGLKH